MNHIDVIKMNKKLGFILIIAISFLIISSPVMASENSIEINQVSEFALFDFWSWIFPPSIDIADVHIVKENYKHTYSDGKVDKSINYYLNFYVNENSADELDAVINSYDKNGNSVDNTTITIYGMGEQLIELNPSDKIASSNLLLYSGNTLVFNETTKTIEKTSDEQVDEPIEKTEDTSSSSSTTYWGSSKSNKFHYPSCEWGQKISSRNKVVFHSRSDAINSGYVPCQVCSP